MFALTQVMAVSSLLLLLVASVSAAPSHTPAVRRSSKSGQGTFFEVGLGACGITNVDTDKIVAVSEKLFDTYPGATNNPNANPICGKKINANFNDKSTTVTVTDRCTGCALNDLDFSPSAFSELADESLGRIDITWDFV